MSEYCKCFKAMTFHNQCWNPDWTNNMLHLHHLQLRLYTLSLSLSLSLSFRKGSCGAFLVVVFPGPRCTPIYLNKVVTLTHHCLYSLPWYNWITVDSVDDQQNANQPPKWLHSIFHRQQASLVFKLCIYNLRSPWKQETVI